jgi:prolyl-tRNA editing enzyme YbaK/EbsC (Cys-tRNA(Pro) deacylase)
MSLESVRQFFADQGVDVPILITTEATATVATAATAHGVSPGQIAKTLAFHLADGRDILVVAAGDVRVDHGKFKRTFGKGKMLAADEVVRLTGHPVGGVCPFGLATPMPVHLDQSLRAHTEMWPAAGSIDSAVRIRVDLMAQLTQGVWVDVCSEPTPAPPAA